MPRAKLGSGVCNSNGCDWTSTIRKHFPSGLSDSFLQSTRHAIVVAIIMKEGAASIAPLDNVIDRARRLNTWLSRHGVSQAIQGVSITPKMISNQKPKTNPVPREAFPHHERSVPFLAPPQSSPSHMRGTEQCPMDSLRGMAQVDQVASIFGSWGHLTSVAPREGKPEP